MPGAYRQYPNTPEGIKEFNFFANLRIGLIGGLIPVLLLELWLESAVGPTWALLLGVGFYLLGVYLTFRFNWGGRLLGPHFGPAASD
jgi:hypothetical protein